MGRSVRQPEVTSNPSTALSTCSLQSTALRCPSPGSMRLAGHSLWVHSPISSLSMALALRNHHDLPYSLSPVLQAGRSPLQTSSSQALSSSPSRQLLQPAIPLATPLPRAPQRQVQDGKHSGPVDRSLRLQYPPARLTSPPGRQVPMDTSQTSKGTQSVP